MTSKNLYKIFLFAFSFSVMAYLAEYSFDFFLKKNYDFKPSYIASGEINADFLIHGPSRAVYHVDPIIVEDSIELSCYNLALNATDINEQLLLLKLYLNHNKIPKVIALEVHRGYIREDAKLFLHSGNYVSFMNEDNIADYIAKEDAFLYKLSYFPLLKYSPYAYSLLNDVVKGVEQFIRGSRELNYKKGFQAKKKEWTDYQKLYHFPERLDYSEELFDSYKSFIELVQQHNIELILFTAPYYKDPTYGNTIIHDLAKTYNLPYWQFNDLPLNQDKNFFYDFTHLNAKGAELFSKAFAHNLSMYLKRLESD